MQSHVSMVMVCLVRECGDLLVKLIYGKDERSQLNISSLLKLGMGCFKIYLGLLGIICGGMRSAIGLLKSYDFLLIRGGLLRKIVESDNFYKLIYLGSLVLKVNAF